MSTSNQAAVTERYVRASESARSRKRLVILAAMAALSVHGALLLATFPDWRVTIDSAYHVAMARAYGEHGLVPWDYINFAPAGRPNLQGPLMYWIVGGLGRLLGGTGADYVLANAIMAAVQWAAAMATASLFALWIGGGRAMLFAAVLLSGSGFAATSFAVGIPSGWLFILTPWAIHFFMRRQLLAATLITSAAIYAHIGGYFTTPVGLFVAAALARRWRDLLLVGAVTAIATAPYTAHCIRYVGWFSGVHGHSALLFDPMLDGLGLAGLIGALKRPRENGFLIAWAGAGIAWLFQDPGRFILQSGIAASVLGGTWLATRFEQMREPWRIVSSMLVVAVATLCPFGVPALGAEAAWVAGIRYPRAINWNGARTLAMIIDGNALDRRPVADYMPALCDAIAVFAPVACEKGHWVEVQLRVDPADRLSAAGKVYILPLNPSDSALESMERRGWIHRWGGTANNSVVTLAARARLDEAAAAAMQTVAEQARWLSHQSVNNTSNATDWRMAFSPAAFGARRASLMEQRARAGRIELALVTYAYALESDYPGEAARMRRYARAFGVIASFLGDDLALDYESDAATFRLKRDLGRLAVATQSAQLDGQPSGSFMNAADQVVDGYLVTEGTTFAVRPPGNSLPWL